MVWYAISSFGIKSTPITKATVILFITELERVHLCRIPTQSIFVHCVFEQKWLKKSNQSKQFRFVATSCVPWEKFRRAMHIPFSISLCKMSTEALAGPVDVCVREGDQ